MVRPAAEAKSRRRIDWRLLLLGAVLVGLTFAVFGQSSTYDFVNYDDQHFVYESPLVSRGLSLDGVWEAFARPYFNLWHPLTTISYLVDYQLHGLRAGGYHFTNVLLHSLSVVFLFLFLHSATSSIWRSFFVAAVFAIHPLHVESVAWISERKDVLSAVFFMITLVVYTAYTRKPSVWRYVLVAASLGFGLMAKPMLITVPLVLLLLDYWPLRRFDRVALGKLLVEKVPLLLLSAAVSLVTLVSMKTAISLTDVGPLSARLKNAVVAPVIYLRQMLWPVNLAPFYPHPGQTLLFWQVAAASALLVTITIVTIVTARRRPYLLVGWFWYLVMLAPVLGIVQNAWHGHADRYTYLTQIGLYLAIAWLVVDLTKRWPYQRQIVGSTAAIIIAILSWRAAAQTSHWRNSEVLWRHTLAVDPNNSAAHQGLGVLLLRRGRTDQAIEHFGHALELRPRDSELLDDLAAAYVAKGDINQAIVEWRKSVELWGGDANAQRELGVALLNRGQTSEAIPHLRNAVMLAHDSPKAHYNLGTAFLQSGEIDRAMAEFNEELKGRPDDIEARNNLGIACLKAGHTRDAIAQWKRVLELQPRNPSAHANLAWVLATDPDSTIRDATQALEHAREAEKIEGDRPNPRILRVIAAALAENRRFSEAITAAKRGAQIALAGGASDLAARLASDIDLYELGIPLREMSSGSFRP